MAFDLSSLFSNLGDGGAANQTSSLMAGTPYSGMTLGDIAAVAPDSGMATMAGNAAQGNGGGLLGSLFAGGQNSPLITALAHLGLGMMGGGRSVLPGGGGTGGGGMGGGARNIPMMPDGMQVLAALRSRLSPGGGMG